MQQRQLRLGDILDDYCPRERRLTNHAVVAMVGPDVKQTRCTTCDADHEYKHARVPRQRPKPESAPFAPPGAGVVPKRVPAAAVGAGPGAEVEVQEATSTAGALVETPVDEQELAASAVSPDDAADETEAGEDERDGGADSGPVHRRLIRATLPRLEGQPPPARPPSDFTIRQPAGRGQRFRPRHQRMDQPFNGHRTSGGGGNSMHGGPRPNTGRGLPAERPSNRRGHGGRRPK
jgi:hypothetical protein